MGQSEVKRSAGVSQSHRGVGPQAAPAAVSAGGAGGVGVLAEVVVAGDGLPAQVAHAAAAAARHAVAAARLDQPRAALGALPDPRRRHALLTENTRVVRVRVRVSLLWRGEFIKKKKKSYVYTHTHRHIFIYTHICQRQDINNTVITQ